MFDKYPKLRLELNGEYKEVYSTYYKMDREGETTASGLAQKVEAWLHKKVAADVKSNLPKKTLEIGAGTLNQLKYELPHDYEIVEPFKKLYADSPYLSKIKNIYTDIDEINLTKKYDRITSVATFEHIIDLPKVVAKTCILLNEQGTLRTAIPNEGTFIWTLGWKVTTGLEFRLKYGLDYGVIMKHEHVNNANEVEEVLKHFYKKNKVTYFGLGKNLALYRFYESSEPKVELAKKYINYLKQK